MAKTNEEMLKIYSNENNPATLKLLVAKNVANISIQVKILNPHESSPHQTKLLPYLVVHDERHGLFSSNAALCFILPPKVNATEIYNWLEWEATELAPNLALLLGGSSKNIKVKNSVENSLTYLNDYLQNKPYLVGDSLSSADIAVWSVVYPLTCTTKTTTDYLNQLSNLVGWITNLEKNTSFKEALSAFKIDGNSYSALLTGAKYLVLPETNEVPKTEQYNLTKEKESPQHTVEAVTNEEMQAARKAWEKSVSQKLKPESKCVLPVPGEQNILITSALPYVNNVPHLGNIIGCVLSADVFARYSRLCNNNTLFICGTDEYGTATETKALEEGLSCKDICDKYHKIHADTYKWFNISFDHFGRTSEPEQTNLCQEMFLTLNSNGFMFTESVEQLHCEKCNKFLADRFVEGGCPNIGCNYEDARGDQCDGCGKLVNAIELKNPRCKICGHTPKMKSSNQFFIDLPKLEPLVRHWIQLSGPGWSNNAQVIAKSWLKEGLKPRCITRDLKWGVPVPLDGFRNKVFYVWFDAPIGYLSISKAYTQHFEKWWLPSQDTKITLYQFMAKDNVPFHSVLFPAMLLGANKGYTTVSHLMATEYLNYEDGKFSKSRGVGVFGTDARSTGIPSDVWRFYLLYVRPETQDSSFSWNDLVTKNNSELLNNLGNFINRALMFAKNNFNRTVPKMEPDDDDYTLLALCTREYKSYVASVGKAKLRDGIRHILTISRHGNQYMQANQPWVLLKGSDKEKSRAGTIIGICCNLACLLATLLQPYMPDTSESLRKQLNTSNIVIVPDDVEIVTLLPAGHQLGEPSPLFAKIELAQAEQLKKKFAGTQSERNGDNVDLKNIQEQVDKQADKVRVLKSSGAEKSLWQPEVAILLDLKKKLEAAQKPKAAKSVGKPVQQSNGLASPEEIKKIEEEVAQQADKVRALKLSGENKLVWQPEVAILLDLKKKLDAAQKSASSKNVPIQQPVINGSLNPEGVKRLEDEIAQQGLVVRKLKEGGAAKSEWQPEVTKLLDLKKQLSDLTGAPTAATQKSKKGKK